MADEIEIAPAWDVSGQYHGLTFEVDRATESDAAAIQRKARAPFPDKKG